MPRRLLIACVASAAALLAACSTTGNLPPAPRDVVAPAQAYKIGPLDVLNIVVWRNPEVSGAATVRPDGYVSMALIGEVKAAGKTPQQLSEEIKQSLSKMVLDPVVNVVVTSALNVNADQIRIVGEASRPQAILYRQSMTLLDVMLMAGGLTNVADGNNAVLVRGAEGGKQYSIRLKDLLKGGDLSANVPVLPGDIVTVPQSVF
jgi:polysaccharide export outer membrane protein